MHDVIWIYERERYWASLYPNLAFLPKLLLQNIMLSPTPLPCGLWTNTYTAFSFDNSEKHSMWLQHLYSPTNCSTASNVTLCRAEKKKKRHQKDPSIDYSGRIKPPGTRQEHFCNWEQAKKARKILPKKADDRDHTVELMPSNPPKTKKKILQN